MYIRTRVWQQIDLDSSIYNGWQNVVQLSLPCVDIRLNLIGYGWKISSEYVNLPVLYFGKYSCYYRLQGTSDWTKFASIRSERASTDEDRVYKDIFVSTGVIPEGMYEIRIDADDGEKFSYWGGTIEGITQNNAFFYNLKVRGRRPDAYNVFDDVGVVENANLGCNPIPLMAVENISTQDVALFDTNWAIGQYASLSIQETVNVNIVGMLFVAENISVYDAFNTLTDWVNLGNPVQNVSVQENIFIQLSFLALQVQENISVSDVPNLGFTILNVIENEDISIDDLIRKAWTVPPMHTWVLADDPEPKDLLSVGDYFGAYLCASIYTDDCSSLSSWTNESSGAGYATVVSGHFELYGYNLSNVASIKKSTGVDWGTKCSISFDFMFKTSTYGGSIYFMINGSNYSAQVWFQKNSGMITFLNGSNSVPINGGNDFSFDTWYNLKVIFFCNRADGKYLADVYLNNTFKARCTGYGYSPVNGLIQFKSYENEAIKCIDNIKVCNISDPINQYAFILDAVTVTESKTIQIQDRPPRSVVILEPVINIVEYQFVRFDGIPLVYDEVTVVSEWAQVKNAGIVEINVFESVNISERTMGNEEIRGIYEPISVIESRDVGREMITDDGTHLANWAVAGNVSETANGYTFVEGTPGTLTRISLVDDYFGYDYWGGAHTRFEFDLRMTGGAGGYQGFGIRNRGYQDYYSGDIYVYGYADGTLQIGSQTFAGVVPWGTWNHYRIDFFMSGGYEFTQVYIDDVLVGEFSEAGASASNSALVYFHTQNGTGSGAVTMDLKNIIMTCFASYYGNPALGGDRYLFGYQNVSITEYANWSSQVAFWLLDVYESIGIAEYRDLLFGSIGIWGAYEDIGVEDIAIMRSGDFQQQDWVDISEYFNAFTAYVVTDEDGDKLSEWAVTGTVTEESGAYRFNQASDEATQNIIKDYASGYFYGGSNIIIEMRLKFTGGNGNAGQNFDLAINGTNTGSWKPYAWYQTLKWRADGVLQTEYANYSGLVPWDTWNVWRIEFNGGSGDSNMRIFRDGVLVLEELVYNVSVDLAPRLLLSFNNSSAIALDAYIDWIQILCRDPYYGPVGSNPNMYGYMAHDEPIVTITENFGAEVVDIRFVDVYEAVSIAEWADRIQGINQTFSVKEDDIAWWEYVALSIFNNPELDIFEAISVDDVENIYVIPLPAPNVFDTVSVIDVGSIRDLHIGAFDIVSILEDAATYALYVDVFEALSIEESLEIGGWWTIYEDNGDAISEWYVAGTVTETANGYYFDQSLEQLNQYIYKSGTLGGDGYWGGSHIAFEFTMKIWGASVDNSGFGVKFEGCGQTYPLFDYNFSVLFRPDGYINAGGSTFGPYYSLDEWNSFRIEVWGGSRRYYIRVFQNDSFIFEVASTSGAALMYPKIQIQFYRSYTQTIYGYVSNIKLDTYDDFYGDISGNPNFYGLDYDNISIAEVVGMAVV